MTVLDIPEATVSVGGTSIATENIMDVHVHLGCTKEVSNFEVVVDNSNPDYHEADYSPGGDKEFTKGAEVIVKCTRGTISGSTKALITGDLESLEYVDQAEDYQYRDIVIIRGRCKGQELFFRKFDGDLIALVDANEYLQYKRGSGEAESMIAYLIDNYTETPLSHIRVTDLLASNAAASQKDVVVTDGTKFTAGDLVKIYDDNAWEYNKIASIATNTLTMTSDLIAAYTTAANAAVGLDLIRDSNTTYTKMLFSHETIFDIIKFISDTASTSGGAIGYDSRVEYDGKYAWLPRGLVTESNFDLTAEVQLERFIDDTARIKNKITVYGKADKPYPLEADNQEYSDIWTEDLVPSDSSPLTANASSGQKVVVVADGSRFSANDYVMLIDKDPDYEFDLQIDSIDGNSITMKTDLTKAWTTAKYSILFQLWAAGAWVWAPKGANDDYTIGHEVTSPIDTGSKSVQVAWVNSLNSCLAYVVIKDKYDLSKFSKLFLRMYFTTTAPTYVSISFQSGVCGLTRAAGPPHILNLKADEWNALEIPMGKANDDVYLGSKGANFDWTDVRLILIYVEYAAAGTYTMHIDRMYVGNSRWGGHSTDVAVAGTDGFAEDASSKSTYGTREHVVISDLLLSDKECEAKAQSLLAFFKDPRATYELESESLDWGDYPIYPGDKISVDLTPLGITGDKRIDSVDIHLTSIDHKLITTFILDNTPPRQADYLYNLSKKVRQLERAYIFIR